MDTWPTVAPHLSRDVNCPALSSLNSATLCLWKPAPGRCPQTGRLNGTGNGAARSSVPSCPSPLDLTQAFWLTPAKTALRGHLASQILLRKRGGLTNGDDCPRRSVGLANPPRPGPGPSAGDTDTVFFIQGGQ